MDEAEIKRLQDQVVELTARNEQLVKAVQQMKGVFANIAVVILESGKVVQAQVAGVLGQQEAINDLKKRYSFTGGAPAPEEKADAGKD